MALLFPILWVVGFVFAMKKNKELIYSPLVWLLIGWGFIYGLYCFSGIEYSNKLSVSAFCYYWGVFLMFFLGTRVANRISFRIGGNQRKKIQPRIDEINRGTYKLYFIGCVFGCIMYIFDIVRLNTISFNLHTYINISGIGNTGILLSGLGLILWLYDCIYAVKNNVRFKASTFISIVCYLVPNMIVSGRQSIIILCVSTFVILFYSFSKYPNYRYSIYIKVPIGLGIIGLFSYTTFIASDRAGVGDKVALFNYMFNSKLSEATLLLLDKLGAVKIFVIEGLYYYSHEVSMFEVFWKYYEGPKFWGMSQLQLISRNITAGEGTVFDLMWNYLNDMSERAGVYSHVWRSASANCIIDFGKFGGLIFAFLCGYIIWQFYKKVRKSESIYGTVGLALVCAGMLFSMQYSPICDANWLYPYFWWFVLPFLEKLLVIKQLYMGNNLNEQN